MAYSGTKKNKMYSHKSKKKGGYKISGGIKWSKKTKYSGAV